MIHDFKECTGRERSLVSHGIKPAMFSIRPEGSENAEKGMERRHRKLGFFFKPSSFLRLQLLFFAIAMISK